jgi:hypothetical protein
MRIIMDTSINGSSKFTNVSRFARTNRFEPRNRFGATTTAERAGMPRVGAGACCAECAAGRTCSKTVQPAPAPPPVAAAPPPPVAYYVAPPVVGAGQMRTMGAGAAFADAIWNNRSRNEKIAIGVGGGALALLAVLGVVAALSGSSDDGASEANEEPGDDADDALDDAGLFTDSPMEPLSAVADALDVDIVDARAAAAAIDAPKVGGAYALTRDQARDLASELDEMGAAEESDDDDGDEDLDDENAS